MTYDLALRTYDDTPNLVASAGRGEGQIVTSARLVDDAERSGAPSEVISAPRQLLRGSGPVPGVLEVSPRAQSTAAFRNYAPSEAVEFVFDPSTQRFVVGRPHASAGLKGSPHQQLAGSIGSGDNVVGGMFRRGPNGQIVTNEASGHFFGNWNPSTRQSFMDFMREYGFDVSHTPGM